MTTVLDVHQVSFSYPGRRMLPFVAAPAIPVLDDITFSVESREIVGVVGESGCGKSTLARCVTGIEAPDSGTVLLSGEPLGKRRTRAQRRAVQMVFQDPYSSLDPRMTVREAIEEVLRIHKIVPSSEIDARVASLLNSVGLSPRVLDLLPRRLSGGQRQRVSLARALALEPELLIADEVVSALDVSVQATILNLLLDLRQEFDITTLFISHDLAVIDYLCDRVMVMFDGRIIERGPASEVMRNPQHSYTQELLAAIPRTSEPAPGESRPRMHGRGEERIEG